VGTFRAFHSPVTRRLRLAWGRRIFSVLIIG
jgi:hypothetical protein